MDGQRVIHAQINSGVWEPDGKTQKMLNIWLPAGEHQLGLSRPAPWGIPWIQQLQFRPARNIAGMVRTSILTDVLVRRKGENVPLKLTVGKLDQPAVVHVEVCPENSKTPVWSTDIPVPIGTGNLEKTIDLPADQEGTFEAFFTDGKGMPVDRTIQYLVVDVTTCPPQDQKPTCELVQEIDCATIEPDYVSGKTNVVHAPLGSYRETGDKGRRGFNRNADWFAYTIQVPTIDEPYLAQIEYPDDDQRVTLISMIDRVPNPYAPTLGYASGGIYSLSGKMLTQEFYFYPRQNDMRLFIQNWQTGFKAAVGKVRIYRLSSMPNALTVSSKGRYFGGYQEENIRFTSYYGAIPAMGNTWSNYFKSACRYAQNQKHIGGNFWQQTVGNYQQALWPQKTIMGYGAVDETRNELEGGPILSVHPEPLDIMRMQLLVCEKFNMGYLGELLLPPNKNFKRHMDKQFGGKGTFEDNGPHKPWLLFNNKGEHFTNSHYGDGYWNPLYPGVQDWVASVIKELADRYKDSPAFKGVSIRLAAWCFSSWQCFPSIEYGYGDYTIALFEKETEIRVPVSQTDPERFEKRYAWLMGNVSDQWVNWRCRKIYAYHSRLAKILTDARPDLKLYFNTLGPDFSQDYEYAEKLREQSWAQIVQGSGIDVDLYNANPALVLQDSPNYPSSQERAKSPLQAANRRDCNWNQGQYIATASQLGDGTVGAMMYNSDSFEGEMVESKALGFEHFKVRNKTTVHGAGELNPAGIHYLDRFAEAMAHSNVTVMAGGNHGYDQQQAQYIRPFLNEYRCLPAIGMNPVELDADPVAVWQGADQGKSFFYAVNRLDQPVSVTLSLTGDAMPRRLTTGELLSFEKGLLNFKLGPYQLIGFCGGSDAIKVTAIKTTVPDAVKNVLKQQIDFSMQLLNQGGDDVQVINLSPMQFKQGFEALQKSQTALEAGRVVTSRRQLLSLEMTRVYEAFGIYPPGLYYRKSPAPPLQALSATDLRNATWPASTPSQVIPAGKIDPALSGRDAFIWYGPKVTVQSLSRFSNRFGLELVCAKTPEYACPQIAVDQQVLPDEFFYREEGDTWTRLILKEPLALQVGAHQIGFKQGKKNAGVLYMNLTPLPRKLVASDWRVLGPFPGAKDPRKGNIKELLELMRKVHAPEKELDFKAKYEGLDGQIVSWKRPDFATDFVDLHQATGALIFKIGYAACMIDSPFNREAELTFGVDYWARIWVNDKQVFDNVGKHNASPFKNEYKIPISLKAGRNKLLVKIHSGGNGNGFWMSISDFGDLTVLTAKDGEM
jgi:hypothetical protein